MRWWVSALNNSALNNPALNNPWRNWANAPAAAIGLRPRLVPNADSCHAPAAKKKSLRHVEVTAGQPWQAS
jgi:hypothetical protein